MTVQEWIDYILYGEELKTPFEGNGSGIKADYDLLQGKIYKQDV